MMQQELDRLDWSYKGKNRALKLSQQDMEDVLLYRRVIEWNRDEDYLVLDNGNKIFIEMTEQVCCAYAEGNWKDVKLDAMITNVEFGEVKGVYNGDSTDYSTIVTLFHNQNPVAIAQAEANEGNGGYYYSVVSFIVVNEKAQVDGAKLYYHPIIETHEEPGAEENE